MTNEEKLIEYMKPYVDFNKRETFNFFTIQTETKIDERSLDTLLRGWESKGYITVAKYAENVPFYFLITPMGSKALFG